MSYRAGLSYYRQTINVDLEHTLPKSQGDHTSVFTQNSSNFHLYSQCNYLDCHFSLSKCLGLENFNMVILYIADPKFIVFALVKPKFSYHLLSILLGLRVFNPSLLFFFHSWHFYILKQVLLKRPRLLNFESVLGEKMQ